MMTHPNPHDIIKEEQESYVKEKLPPPDGCLPVDVRVLYEALRTNIFAPGLYIGKLLEELGLHDRSTYCRFNLHFRRTPKDFVIFHRMQLAKRLLAISSLSISSIALSIGYDRPHAFSQTFKRRTGYAPSVYRGGGKNDGKSEEICDELYEAHGWNGRYVTYCSYNPFIKSLIPCRRRIGR